MQNPARQSPLQRRLLQAGLTTLVILIAIWGHPGLRAEFSGHPYVDAVLVPRFTADFNDWWHQHPKEPDHFSKIDVKDRKRWEAACETFEALKREMKNAGY